MKIRILTALMAAAFLVAIAPSCANRGSGPQGGPRDTIPPVVLEEIPLNGSLNYQKKVVTVYFDENITLDNVAENVLISPPQKQMPAIQAINKRLTVKFNADTLLPNTTYTIDFGPAIQDNNEKNVLEGYRFSFATGPAIDTLRISGTLIEAETLNPVQGKLVGVYRTDDSGWSDTVFTSRPFDRVGKSDSEGRFTIDNLSAGTYRIFALGDNNRDYYFQPGEGLAMLDTLLTPSCQVSLRADTTWADSMNIDTIRSSYRVAYQPDSLLLRYFTENKKRQYLVSTTRKEANQIVLNFGAPADTVPLLSPVGDDWLSALRLQDNPTHDTLTYWIADSLVINRDTLEFAVTYLKTDSVYQFFEHTDTVRAIYRRPRISDRAKKRATRPEPLKLALNASSEFDVYRPLTIRSEAPVDSVFNERIRLLRWKDTVSTALPFTLEPSDNSGLGYQIAYAWEPEATYELVLDSAAFKDVYGKTTDQQSNKFTIKSLDKYAKLIVTLEPYDPKAVIQILNTQDKPVRTLPATDPKGAVFEYLAPGEYYMRLFIDTDGNGRWTTGNYDLRQQPEAVYYFPSKLTLRANWDAEEPWDYLTRPLLQQKPSDLLPNTSNAKASNTPKNKGFQKR